jgi:hypothetical protein
VPKTTKLSPFSPMSNANVAGTPCTLRLLLIAHAFATLPDRD